MIFWSTLLIGLISSTPQPQTSVANAAQGVHRLDPTAQIVSQDFVRQNVFPYLEPHDAMNAKKLLEFSEEKIISLFAASKPKKVAEYILRELDNPQISDDDRWRHLQTFFDANSRYPFTDEISLLIANGKVGLLRRILNVRRFSRRRFSREQCLKAVKNGDAQMVEFMLEKTLDQSFHDDYQRLLMTVIEISLHENQFEVFQMVADKETHILEALRAAIFQKNKKFSQYCIEKINAGLGRITLSDTWYAGSVLLFLRYRYEDSDESLEMLKFLLDQPNWNPNIQELLTSMEVAGQSSALELIRQEFVRHPSLTDEHGIPRSPGVDSLNAAIQQAESTPIFRDLVETLRGWKDNIQSI